MPFLPNAPQIDQHAEANSPKSIETDKISTRIVYGGSFSAGSARGRWKPATSGTEKGIRGCEQKLKTEPREVPKCKNNVEK